MSFSSTLVVFATNLFCAWFKVADKWCTEEGMVFARMRLFGNVK